MGSPRPFSLRKALGGELGTPGAQPLSLWSGSPLQQCMALPFVSALLTPECLFLAGVQVAGEGAAQKGKLVSPGLRACFHCREWCAPTESGHPAVELQGGLQRSCWFCGAPWSPGEPTARGGGQQFQLS